MNSPHPRTLPFDRNAEAIVEEAKQGIREDLAAIKRRIQQSKDARRLTHDEVIELCRVIRDGSRLIQTRHFDRNVSVLGLLGILTEIDADPEEVNGRIEVVCMCAGDLMQLGASIAAYDQRCGQFINERAKYDPVKFRAWWDADDFVEEQ